MKFYLRKEESTVKTGSGSVIKCNTIAGALANNTQHAAYCYRFTPHSKAPPTIHGGRGFAVSLQTVSALEKVDYFL